MTLDTKAQLMYCMDYIVHHIRDREHREYWARRGCPDDCVGVEPPADRYKDLCFFMTDKDIYHAARLFTEIMARTLIPDLPCPTADYPTAETGFRNRWEKEET